MPSLAHTHDITSLSLTEVIAKTTILKHGIESNIPKTTILKHEINQ